MEKEWGELTPDEKQEALFQKCLAAEGVEFANPAAEKAYKERLTRLKDAIQLKKMPDRVPVLPITSFFPAFYSGMTPYDVMYDYDKMLKAFKKFTLDFAPDSNSGAGTGGARRYTYHCNTIYSGGGGNGGGWGAGGSTGTTGNGNRHNTASGGGGAAGYCISGNSYISWVATGTRYGAIS